MRIAAASAGRENREGMVDVAAVLRELGSKELEVARTLDWVGVTGRRQSTSACPVSNFVRLYFPDAFDVVVTPTDVCVWEEHVSVPTLAAHVETPTPISSFIASFDSGKYPRLDDRVGSLGSEWVEHVLTNDANAASLTPHRVPV